MNIRQLIIALLALGALAMAGRAAAALPGTPENRDRLGSYFALNGSKIFHIPDEIDTTVKRRIDYMHELGVFMDRIDFWWGTIEPEKGTWDWTIPDKCLAYLESRGVQLYPILAYGAKWWPDRTAPQNEEEVAQYAEYVYQMVNRYKDRITYWSVWNEPNIAPFWTPQPDPDMYAKLLKAAYEAAKRADQDCKISAPVVAPLGRWDEKFIRRMYELGCKDFFDVFDYHYYRDSAPERAVPRELAEIRALMAQYGDEDKPIWISEFGVTSPIEKKAETYDKQASLVVRNHLVCLAEGVEKLFYFDLQNWHDRTGETWDGKLGLIEAGWERKPSFTAYQTMVRMVDHRDVVGRVRGLGEGVEGALIHDAARSEYVLAVWTTEKGATRNVTLTCEARDVTIVKGTGETTVAAMTPPPAPGQRTREVTVEVNWHPQYVRGVDKMTYLPRAGLALHPARLQISPGETRALILRAHPELGAAVKVKTIEGPKFLLWSQDDQRLRAADDAGMGEHDVKVIVEVEGDPVGLQLVAAQVEIVPPVRVALRPAMKDGALSAGVTIVNQTKSPLTNTAQLLLNGEVISAMESVKVGPMATEIISMTMEAKALPKNEPVAQWSARYGNAASRPVYQYAMPFRAGAPEIDGDLAEWAGMPGVVMKEARQVLRGNEGWSPADSSGTVRVWATKKVLYVAADVTDDAPLHNPHKANELWRGDAIELYLGLGGPSGRTVLDKAVEFQIGLAPTYEGGTPVAFYFHVDKIMEQARVAAKKTEKGWALEAAIPLAELGDFALKPGDWLGFDTAINDQDPSDWAPEANVPGSALMWNGTGMNWIDPSGWGMAVVTE